MKWYLPLCLLILTISCTDDSKEEISAIEDCVWGQDVKRIFDKNKESACIYSDVYKRDGQLFSICYCCACLKALRILSCDGTNICIGVSDCKSDFLKEAEYLYSFE